MKELTIFGLRSVIEAIDSNQSVDKVWLAKSSNSILHKELVNKLKESNISYSYLPRQGLDRMSKGKNHQGVMAKISPIELIPIEKMIQEIGIDNKNPPVYLLLDGITDTRNFGAILRTANAINITGVIISSSSSAPINEDVVKTSSGAIFNVPISKVNNLKDAIYLLQEKQIEIIGMSQNAKDLIYEKNLKNPTAIILGSEDRGISKGLLKIIDQKAKLPMAGSVGSLNVSVACSVALYEVVRQRST